jgi:hypothetical protein
VNTYTTWKLCEEVERKEWWGLQPNDRKRKMCERESATEIAFERSEEEGLLRV